MSIAVVRALGWRVGALSVLAIFCAGCIELPPPPPPGPVATVVLNLSFKNATAAKQAKSVAKLSYAVSTPSGDLPMELTDPDNPQGAVIKLSQCTIRTQPFVGIPEVTNERMQECKVHCCYTVCVRDPQGGHLGDFEINDWGALVLKGATVPPDVDVQRVSTSEHTVYFFYHNKPGAPRTNLLFALEFHLNKFFTKLTSVASDGWRYTFWSPDGKLLVHDPSTLAGKQEKLLAQAAAEQGQRDQDLAAWDPKKSSQSCRTGGG